MYLWKNAFKRKYDNNYAGKAVYCTGYSMKDETKLTETQSHTQYFKKSRLSVPYCSAFYSEPYTIVDMTVTSWTSQNGVFL